MNIFLPYESDIQRSVQSLDDSRLNKQILETYQLLKNALKESIGVEIKGYKNHPIYVHYKDNIPFLAYYGYQCCLEFSRRFDKLHKLHNGFAFRNGGMNRFDVPQYTPFYMEGSKGQPNYIRTTDNVSALFQAKLCKKWDNDKAKGRPPKWTKRAVPNFYQWKDLLEQCKEL